MKARKTSQEADGKRAEESENRRLNQLLFYAVVLLLGYLGYRIVEPFLAPLAWAGILALCAQPLNARVSRRMGPGAAAGLSTAAVGVLLIVPAVLLAVALAGEIGTAIGDLQGSLGSLHENERVLKAWAWAEAHVPQASPEAIQERLGEIAARLTKFVAGQAGAALQTSSVFLFKLFVTLFALYFFLRDGREIGGAIRAILPFEKQRKEELMGRTRELVFAGTMATLAVAAAQGVAGGALFAALGLRAPVFWGAAMAFCALLPMFGTALVWGPAALGLMVFGSWGKGLALLALGTVLVGGMDNVLRPMLVSGKSRMNGLTVFVAILGGVAAFGFVGLVLGPVVAAAATSLLRHGACAEGEG